MFWLFTLVNSGSILVLMMLYSMFDEVAALIYEALLAL